MILDVKAMVFEALDNSDTNGYNPRGTEAIPLAVDLMMYDADLESVCIDDILEHVKAWKATHA